jgi:hypothetical protein
MGLSARPLTTTVFPVLGTPNKFGVAERSLGRRRRLSVRPAHRLRGRLGRRVIRVIGWGVGAPLALFRFFRRQTVLEETISTGGPGPLGADDAALAQRESEQGVGKVVHRLYSATIRTPQLPAARLLAIIATDPNVIAPSEVLRFEKTSGQPGRLEEGDELLIRMAGPWNAPVKVTRRWEEGFRFAATGGHPQLGQVELRTRDDDGDIAIEVQTRERAAGVTFHVLQRITLIQRMQNYTWGEMLQNAAQLAGGRRLERITVRSWPQR